MDIFSKVSKDLTKVIAGYLGEVYSQNPKLAGAVKFVIPPMETGCDFSTNASMVFAKVSGKKPTDLAQELAKEMASSGVANSGEQIIIQQAVVNIEPGVIASDYDARRAGELALEEMMRISRKATNRSLSRR